MIIFVCYSDTLSNILDYTGQWQEKPVSASDYCRSQVRERRRVFVMEEKLIESEHSVSMDRRKSCHMTGIRDVVAFDEHIVLLKTELGDLEIRGENLHIRELTLEAGLVELEGLVSSMEYQDNG